MKRFRGTDVGLGVLAIAVNVALVVAVVVWVSGRNDEPARPTPAATASASTTPSGSPTPRPSGAAAVLARDTPTTIAVLGDQTSDGTGEWVSIFAELLGRHREVTLHQLDPQDPTVYAAEQSFGSSESAGPEVTIYNGSRAEANADYAATRLAFLSPEEPDLVVLNYGRNDSSNTVGARLESTTAAVRKAWKDAVLVVTLQPPTTDDGSKEVRDEVVAWAQKRGVQTLDVAQEFLDTGEPNAYVSPRDRSVMSGRGDRLWGRTAYRLLVGSDPAEEDQSTEPTPSESTATEPATLPSTIPRGTGGSRPRTTTPTEPDPEPTDIITLPTESIPPPPTEPTDPDPPTTEPTPTTPPPVDPPPPADGGGTTPDP